jgi:hypothetical protein
MKNQIALIVTIACAVYCKNSNAQAPPATSIYNTPKETQAAKDYQKKYAPIKDVNNYYKPDKAIPATKAERSDSYKSPSEGILLLKRVKANGKYGYTDGDGKEALPAIYDDAAPKFSEGLASINIGGKCGFIDRVGRVIIPLMFDNTYIFNNGLACVVSGGKWGFINKSGVTIIPLKYDLTDIFFDEELVWVKLNGKYGYVNKSGVVIIPIKYDAVGSFFEDGLIKVKLNEKWGFVNRSGIEVIPPIYDYAKFFTLGKAEVSLQGNKFFIDKTGARVQ